MKQFNQAIAKIRRNLQTKADKASYELKEGFATTANRIHDREKAERFLRAWLYEAQKSCMAQSNLR